MQRIKTYIKDNLPLILLFLIAAVIECSVVFPLMATNYLNYDSTYQYGLTQHSIPEIWELLPLDYSPPFYAIALKLFTMVFGNSLIVMRAFSLFAVIGMYFIAAFPMNELFGKKTAYICVILTFSSTAVLNLLHEIRPTIFGMFFFMAAAVYAACAYILDKKHCYICMTVFSVLAMYTHYIALIGAFGIYVTLLLLLLAKKDLKRLRKCLICGIICAVLYIPWLSVVLSQISNVNDYYWTSVFGITDSLQWIFFDPLNTSTIFKTFMPSLIMIFLYSVLLRHIRLKELKSAAKLTDALAIIDDKKIYRTILILMLFILVPTIILQGVNFFLRNLASDRYCYILGTVWIAALSAVMGRLGNKIFCILLTAAVIINNAINVYLIKADLDRSNMTEIVSDICEREPDGNIAFLHMHEYSLGMMSYYFPDAKHYVCDKTFTVLRSYDIFPAEVTDIGDCENIWNYTDRCYIFTNDLKFNNTLRVYSSIEVLEEVGNCEITDIRHYHMPYCVATNDYDLAVAVYTGDSEDE